MTSEIDALKTNEFIRRRKLRLQQVREQSKDIAKKIRQRAKVEKLKQVDELDFKNRQNYFHHQEQLVKKLEEFYVKGIENLGVSHKNASQLKQQENQAEKVDPSKQRGREAAAELRKRRQDKLDEQKKLLDRKLQAREAANEVSREKSASIAQKLSKATSKDIEAHTNKITTEATKHVNTDATFSEVKCADMATQWDCEPCEWEPSIPVLPLSQDDKDSVKETNNNIESKSEKSKHPNLFALSEEMPSSLRGGSTAQEARAPVKPSLTLVSEYLQTRSLRLRETQATITDTKKKNMQELDNLKQTILRGRVSKAGTAWLCQVHDEEIMPVPTWEAEHGCGVCAYSLHNKYLKHSKQCCNTHRDIFGPTKPFQTDVLPSPILRGCTPFKRNKLSNRSCTSKDSVLKTSKTSDGNSSIAKKSSVPMYNHSTRNVQDIPYHDEGLVVRDLQRNDDAYSLAMKESYVDDTQKNKQNKKVVENRSRVAVNKQNVEKEYRDTISFLNTLPRNMGEKPIRRAFMDEDRQQSIINSRQQKLQHEYKKVIRDCKKTNCRSKTNSKSPAKSNDFDSSDFQYSWMPVPEEDGKLAIHAIPTSLKEDKTGNTVKFSKVDSYHEYRSRHKHTPPTKETSVPQFARTKHSQNSSEEESTETSISEVISLEMREQKYNNTEKLSDTERIIIYKVLDSKNEKLKKTKIMKNIAKSLSLLNKEVKNSNESFSKSKLPCNYPDKGISFEQLKEGVYKTVNENGTGDNVASMYFTKNVKRGVEIELTEDDINGAHPCCCSKVLSKDKQKHKGTSALSYQWERGDNSQKARSPSINSHCKECKCGIDLEPKGGSVPAEPPNTLAQGSASTATSTASFKTAGYDKASSVQRDGGFIKLLDEGGEETGKLYVGASGFLGDDAYEVVIQLRKKGDEKEAKDSIEKLDKDNNDQEKVVPDLAETVETTEKDAVQTDCNTNASKDSDSPASNVNFPSDVAVSRVTVSGPTGAHTRSTNVKDVAEKGVATSFQDSFTDVNLMNSESKPKAVTSACTQTSLSSPTHRPVLLHMSSTTSTAYMSPPEMILPKFLKHDYSTPDDGIYTHGKYMTRDQEVITDHDYSKANECSCIKCSRARKNVRRTTAHKCRKVTRQANRAATPPNTARSEQDELPYIAFKISAKETCSCRKCRRNNMDEPTSSSNFNLNKHALKPKSIHSLTSNKKDKKKGVNSNLNPVLREYVNKLLKLNKASHKAIEIIDLDCSNVTTPGSSIINVSSNNNIKTIGIENKISLEHIKTIVAQQILKELETHSHTNSDECKKDNCTKNTKQPKTFPKKKVHKVKSLNISKNLLRAKKAPEHTEPQSMHTSSSSSNKEVLTNYVPPPQNIDRARSKSSPTPRSSSSNSEMRSRTCDVGVNNAPEKQNNLCTKNSDKKSDLTDRCKSKSDANLIKAPPYNNTRLHAKSTSTSKNQIPGLCETGTNIISPLNIRTPSNISTQTSINSEIHHLRFDEDKIQNMEKIADLTEKCTKRLSNLAKVLDEVRRNKSLGYSQISTSDDSDRKSDKNPSNNLGAPEQSFHDSQKSIDSKSLEGEVQKSDDNRKQQTSESFVPFLTDIPKPDSFHIPALDLNFNSNIPNSSSPADEIYDHNIKMRGKPPPALSRINLKHVQDNLIPHELSTVVEVDSPMSLKLKSLSSRNDTKFDAPESSHRIDNATYKADYLSNEKEPDLLTSKADLSVDFRLSDIAENADPLVESKIQMIDMNQFNEIMLKPFYSLQEYANHNNMGSILEDGSNLEDFVKGELINDEMSSLHSEASLPDVISELLKRNIISEPFKFDTGSKVNSTTVSSESTMSVLALSKMRKKDKKSSVMFQNKGNAAETSDTLSISSNPDLENAFKKLGMGWASSTLKKTKERLALSSSSNTSSSSLTQFKTKSFNQDIPVLVSDTVSSALNVSNKKPQNMKRDAADVSNAQQQTSVTNSIFTVKEFLNNELAKKITFNNKTRNCTEEEFVSLFDTKMPDDLKASRTVREDSVDESLRSNNRARTSTPLQLFKSMTFQSSSSSNMSNGLFSNADDLSSVKHTSNSAKNLSTSEKEDLTIPNVSLKVNKNGSRD